jgi:hypothetical protein
MSDNSGRETDETARDSDAFAALFYQAEDLYIEMHFCDIGAAAIEESLMKTLEFFVIYVTLHMYPVLRFYKKRAFRRTSRKIFTQISQNGQGREN